MEKNSKLYKRLWQITADKLLATGFIHYTYDRVSDDPVRVEAYLGDKAVAIVDELVDTILVKMKTAGIKEPQSDEDFEGLDSMV